jgi:hypothetical protein
MDNVRVGGSEQPHVFGSRQMTFFTVVHGKRQD